MITLHRVIVTMSLTDEPGDEAERVDVTFEGEPTLVTALGMLRLAEDSLLHESPMND